MDNQNPNFEDHLKKALAGEEKSKEMLYMHFCKPMFNICIRMTGNHQDAEDLLHDVFIKAFSALHQLKDPASFPGWLKRITINHCIAFSKKTVNWLALPEVQEQVVLDSEHDWFLHYPLADIHQAIKRLPEGCRQIFTLYAIEDHTHKEIANLLAISESTSKSQYQRARLLLKNRLKMKVHGQV